MVAIQRDISRDVFGFSWKVYIGCAVKWLNMHNCSLEVAYVVKGDNFSKSQCPKNDIEEELMKHVPYVDFIGSVLNLRLLI